MYVHIYMQEYNNTEFQEFLQKKKIFLKRTGHQMEVKLKHQCSNMAFSETFRKAIFQQKLQYIAYTYIHTYIFGHYNPSVRIIDLVSYTTYVVCVNFVHKWRYIQFKVAEQILFVCRFDVWPGTRTLAFRLIS